MFLSPGRTKQKMTTSLKETNFVLFLHCQDSLGADNAKLSQPYHVYTLICSKLGKFSVKIESLLKTSVADIFWLASQCHYQAFSSFHGRDHHRTHFWWSKYIGTFLECRRKWQSTPLFLPGKSPGWRSLAGYIQGIIKSRHNWGTSLTHPGEHESESLLDRGSSTSYTFCGLLGERGASLVAPMIKNLLSVLETQVWFLGQEDPQEREMETHSSILAWKIPWMEEPGRLQSVGSQSQTCTERKA